MQTNQTVQKSKKTSTEEDTISTSWIIPCKAITVVQFSSALAGEGEPLE